MGDIIVSVNGQATEKKTHDEVVEMMNAVEDLIILMQVLSLMPFCVGNTISRRLSA